MEDRDGPEEPPGEAEVPPAEATGRAEARGDVLFKLNGFLQLGDVSVIHPGTSTFRRAAANTAGAAAAHCDK
jgi:hypothetical protein